MLFRASLHAFHVYHHSSSHSCLSVSVYIQFTNHDVVTAFHSFDLDGNNYVGAQELRYIFKKLEEDVLDEEIDEMIRMVDLDGDGQVSLQEFQRMIFKHAEQVVGEDDKITQQVAEEDQARKGKGVERDSGSGSGSEEGEEEGDKTAGKVTRKKQAAPMPDINAAQAQEQYTAAHSKERQTTFRSLLTPLTFSPSLSKYLLFAWTDIRRHVYSLAPDGIVTHEDFCLALKLKNDEHAKRMTDLLLLPDHPGKLQLRDFLICAMITCKDVPRTDKIKC